MANQYKFVEQDEKTSILKKGKKKNGIVVGWENDLIFSHAPTSSGSGGNMTPGLDSIGSEEIKDGSIRTVDLSPEVQAGLKELENEENYATDDMIAKLFK